MELVLMQTPSFRVRHMNSIALGEVCTEPPAGGMR
jgi:hypothetical protein